METVITISFSLSDSKRNTEILCPSESKLEMNVTEIFTHGGNLPRETDENTRSSKGMLAIAIRRKPRNHNDRPVTLTLNSTNIMKFKAINARHADVSSGITLKRVRIRTFVSPEDNAKNSPNQEVLGRLTCERTSSDFRGSRGNHAIA